MLRFLKRLAGVFFVVGLFVWLVVGLVVLVDVAANPTKAPRAVQSKAEAQPTPARSEPEPKPEPEPKTTTPSNKRVERVARQFYDQHEDRIKRANPEASKRTWNGTYQIRPYPDSTGAWVVNFTTKGKSQWSMVIVCENDKWGLARLTVKGKQVYEDSGIHFDDKGVWHLE